MKRTLALVLTGLVIALGLLAVWLLRTPRLSAEDIGRVLHTADTVIITNISSERLAPDSDVSDPSTWQLMQQPAQDFYDPSLVQRLAQLLSPETPRKGPPCLCLGGYRVRFIRGERTVMDFTLHHWSHIRLKMKNRIPEFDLPASSADPLRALIAENWIRVNQRVEPTPLNARRNPGGPLSI